MQLRNRINVLRRAQNLSRLSDRSFSGLSPFTRFRLSDCTSMFLFALHPFLELIQHFALHQLHLQLHVARDLLAHLPLDLETPLVRLGELALRSDPAFLGLLELLLQRGNHVRRILRHGGIGPSVAGAAVVRGHREGRPRADSTPLADLADLAGGANIPAAVQHLHRRAGVDGTLGQCGIFEHLACRVEVAGGVGRDDDARNLRLRRRVVAVREQQLRQLGLAVRDLCAAVQLAVSADGRLRGDFKTLAEEHEGLVDVSALREAVAGGLRVPRALRACEIDDCEGGLLNRRVAVVEPAALELLDLQRDEAVRARALVVAARLAVRALVLPDAEHLQSLVEILDHHFAQAGDDLAVSAGAGALEQQRLSPRGIRGCEEVEDFVVVDLMDIRMAYLVDEDEVHETTCDATEGFVGAELGLGMWCGSTTAVTLFMKAVQSKMSASASLHWVIWASESYSRQEAHLAAAGYTQRGQHAVASILEHAGQDWRNRLREYIGLAVRLVEHLGEAEGLDLLGAVVARWVDGDLGLDPVFDVFVRRGGRRGQDRQERILEHGRRLGDVRRPQAEIDLESAGALHRGWSTNCCGGGMVEATGKEAAIEDDDAWNGVVGEWFVIGITSTGLAMVSIEQLAIEQTLSGQHANTSTLRRPPGLPSALHYHSTTTPPSRPPADDAHPPRPACTMASAPADPKPPKPSSYTIPVSTGHEDLLHGVAYDFYGQRIATCSSDQRIKVFDATDSGEWKENDAWRAHDANISKIAWAHPSFGQIIASCSFDRTVKIFEEQEAEPKSSGRRWRRMSRMIGDTRGAICDISFAPAAVGLKLAYISSDGVVQVQEAMETHAVSRWTSVDEFRVVSAAPSRETETSFCLTYCPSRWGGEQLLVGAMDKVRIYRHDSNGKFQPAEELRGHKGLVRDVSWAPNLGRSYHLIATACKDGYVRIFRLTDPRMTFSPMASRPVSRSRARNFNDDERPPLMPPPPPQPQPASAASHFSSLTREISNLSVGGGGGGSASGRGGATGGGGVGTGGTSTVNFSATGSGVALSVVNSFEKAEDGMGVLTIEEQESRELHGFHVEEIAAFNDHGREVWRVEWNPSGTVLSSAGDDGKIRLWRADRTMRWKCMSVMGSGWKPTRRREDDDDD
ncbi:LOW QUALITY PROTEIN: hypothetical protein Dda_6513 [Drechslerella dactyloides]|uniref:Uncharacterized protein n=1 Tax=Drechslerella dactyloides TaxID=74499 RepID=A0AAD6IU37_DREDA|nr:LOW QUALITY PROTEIN: hypothetical protein Dda_6513 [Drechslerella dactyloides]